MNSFKPIYNPNYPLHVFDFPSSLPPPSFSKEAYTHYEVNEEELEKSLINVNELEAKTNALNEQKDCLLLRAIPNEIKLHIFSFFDIKDLNICLLTCKDFNVISTIFIEKTFAEIPAQFICLEKKIDEKLNFFSYHVKKNATGATSTLQDPFNKIKQVYTKIAAFKSFCVFVANHSSKDKSELKLILKSVLQLEKACEAFLKPKQEAKEKMRLQVQNIANRIHFPKKFN